MLDKKNLTGAFVVGEFPKYQCPTCRSGVLVMDGELESNEIGETKKHSMEEWWDYEFSQLTFSCALSCMACSEKVFVVGTGYIDLHYEQGSHEDDVYTSYQGFYKPEFFCPNLQFIDIPTATPKEVRQHLLTAFKLYFSDPGSSCNSMRCAVEHVVTSLGVPPLKSGEKFYPLKERIDAIAPGNEGVVILLNAIRWLGNSGSHAVRDFQAADALHAFEILELLLEEVYEDRKRKIIDLAQAVNIRRGPVSRTGL
ncbi:DUF4145 domain-containing protein [Pseudomonas sp. P7758]|uniref:DUF4145 domain-containing protein n=1 Tax=Pseudomonas sp. P7758 TaxID=2738830 RepID=UPI00159FB4A6|nr:DUF4145 domain-containing protein [Pseudomonas sp. P7758]NWC70363.1 DUF4145 domain-containing protein [Pseudomonas sp. P7758]